VELRQLKTFRTVAKTLSFTRAAAELGYVQSSITAQIQALERELSVPLFDRLGNTVVLTDAGRRLLGYAEKVVDLVDEARVVLSDVEEPSGALTISASETHCTYRLPRVLSLFRSRYPQVGLALRPSPVGALDAELKRNLGEGAIDLAFLLEEPLRESDVLSVETVVPEPVLVVAPPDHPLTRRRTVDPADLEGEDVLLTEEGCVYRGRFQRALSESGVRGTAFLRFSSIEAIKQCVMVGMGIAVLSAASVTEEIEAGRLKELPWTGPDCGVLTQMVWRKDKWISPALKAFLEVTRESYSTIQA
jgi:DNA-binding transcriptional LysR family regulator